MLFDRIVVQVRPEPSLDLRYGHTLALVIVHDLIAFDLAEAEIARFRMSEIETAYARTGPHRKRFGNQHSSVRFHIKQTPERTLFCVIRACRVTRGGPDSPVLLL